MSIDVYRLKILSHFLSSTSITHDQHSAVERRSFSEDCCTENIKLKPQVGLEAVKLLNATIRLTTDALRKITSRIKSNHSVDAMSLS